MQKTLRIVVALPGVMFLASGLNWLFWPESAAQGLGLPLLDGIARSTQIGDIGSFFFGTSAMILTGSITARPTWLYAAAMLLGGAAAMRVAAWALHGADFAASGMLRRGPRLTLRAHSFCSFRS